MILKKTRRIVGALVLLNMLRKLFAMLKTMFGSLKKHDIPMVSGDHPEIDDSELLTGEYHQKYQMLVGILNWIVALGRLDIGYATASHS